MQRLYVALCVLAFMAQGARAQLVDDLIHAPLSVEAPLTQTIGKVALYTFASNAIEVPFTGIALQGFAGGDSLRGEVRFWEQEVWGAWHELYVVRSATDDAFLAAYRGEDVRMATRAELRITVEAGRTVEIVHAGTFDSRRDTQPPEDGWGIPDAAQDFSIIAPRIYRRRDWNAEPFRGTPIPLNRPSYNYMTLHHTAGFGATTLAEGLEQVRRIQDFHQNGRGWRDIGYQFLMDREGRLYQGRPFLNESAPWDLGPPLAHGAHVGGANTGNIGVSLMGCYHPAEGSNCRDEMTQPAIDSLLTTFAFLSERYGVSPELMRGHRDFSQTACPGDNNYVQLSGFRTQVADLLVAGNAPLGTAALYVRMDSVGVVVLRWAFQDDLGIDEFDIQRKVGESVTTLTTRDTVEDGQIVDGGRAGAYEYLLVARGSRNREQILASAAIEIHTPGHYVLAQNFPNPATDRTTVRYFLRQPGIVKLNMFDVAGRQVTTLEESYREEDVWHSISLDTSDIPSGVYYYQIQLEGFAGTVFNAANPLIVIR